MPYDAAIVSWLSSQSSTDHERDGLCVRRINTLLCITVKSASRAKIARYFCAAWSGTCSRRWVIWVTLPCEMLSGRLLVAVPLDVPWADLEERLRSIFGLANFARCAEAPHDLEAIKQTVSHVLHGRTFASFRITARRAFKEFPFHSLELQQVLRGPRPGHASDTRGRLMTLNSPCMSISSHGALWCMSKKSLEPAGSRWASVASC